MAKMDKQNFPLYIFSAFVTLALIFICVSNGIVVSEFGVSLVHLANMYQTNVAKMSFSVTCATLGAATGSAICGKSFGKFPNTQELVIFISFGIAGALTIILPWMPTLYMFYACTYLRGIPRGYMWQAIHVYLLNTWSGSRYKPFVVQTCITLNTLGSFLNPLIFSPFLSKLPLKDGLIKTFSNRTAAFTGNNTKYASDSPKSISEMATNQPPDISNEVRLPFMITGTAMDFLFVQFVLIFLAFSLHVKDSHSNIRYLELNKNQCEKEPASFNKSVIMAMSSLLVVLMYISQTAMTFLISAFAVEGLGWSVQSEVQINCVFMFGKMLGSIFASVIAVKIPLSAVVFGQVTLTFSGYFLTGMAAETLPSFVWFGVALTGFGTCSSHAPLVVWISDRMTLTQGDITAVQLSLLIGRSIGPSFGGFLFHRFSPISFIYMGMFTSLVEVLVFIVIYFYLTCCLTGGSKTSK